MMETALNFEQVWQLFRETDHRFQETDRKFQESQRALDHRFQETDRKFRETRQEFQETQRALDRRFQETDRKMRALQNLFEGQWGKLMESLVEGDLVHLLQARDVRIMDTSTRRKGHRDGENYEFDIVAHNGEEIVIVEVKTTLRVGHIDAFIRRLHRAKRYMPEYRTHRVLGAVAYLRAEEASDQYGQRQGLFVIRATGDSAAIVNSKDFRPRRFG